MFGSKRKVLFKLKGDKFIMVNVKYGFKGGW